MKKKENYAPPHTEAMMVILENNFMVGSGPTEGDVIDTTGENSIITIDEQTPGKAVGGGGMGFDNNTWGDSWD